MLVSNECDKPQKQVASKQGLSLISFYRDRHFWGKPSFSISFLTTNISPESDEHNPFPKGKHFRKYAFKQL